MTKPPTGFNGGPGFKPPSYHYLRCGCLHFLLKLKSLNEVHILVQSHTAAKSSRKWSSYSEVGAGKARHLSEIKVFPSPSGHAIPRSCDSEYVSRVIHTQLHAFL